MTAHQSLEIDLARRVLYRDALMLIIDKPAGLAVHAGGRGRGGQDEGGDHLGRYLDALRFGLPQAPELAHRLDRDTSGCLVLGRHRRALRRLGALFAEGGVEKVYWAAVIGAPPGESGAIDTPLAKVGPAWNWRVRVDRQGRDSITQWRVLGRHGRISWLECRPLTGRTHQIRVHLASIGCPILGDAMYGHGTADVAADRLHLLARAVSVPLYPGKAPITAEAQPPDHMRAALTDCGWAAAERP